MSATEALRWGILGTGRITGRIARAPVDPRRHVIAAVASRDAERARDHAQRHGIERWHGSYDDLLADPAVDVVYVALPNHLHAPWAIRAIEAGKHVLVEKPIALTVADVDAIATAAARHGRVVAEGFMYLHHPQTRSVLEAIASGRLGSIRLIRGSFSFTLTHPNDPRLDPEMGGGSLWDLGGYPVSFARRALGLDPDEVLAMQVADDGVDMAFVGQLRFPGDRLLVIDTSFRAPDRELLEVVGSEGVLTVDPAFLAPADRPTSYTIVGRDGQRSSVAIAAADAYRAEMDDLAAAIEDGRLASWSIADSRATVAALEALHLAAASIRGIRPLGRPGPVRA